VHLSYLICPIVAWWWPNHGRNMSPWCDKYYLFISPKNCCVIDGPYIYILFKVFRHISTSVPLVTIDYGKLKCCVDFVPNFVKICRVGTRPALTQPILLWLCFPLKKERKSKTCIYITSNHNFPKIYERLSAHFFFTLRTVCRCTFFAQKPCLDWCHLCAVQWMWSKRIRWTSVCNRMLAFTWRMSLYP
jgi:hypothetical protein